MPSRFLDELPAELTRAPTGPRPAATSSGGRGAADAAQRRRRRARRSGVGDDVVHAASARGRDRRRAGRRRGRALRRRRLRAPADGRLRAAAREARSISAWRRRIIDGKAVAARVRARGRRGGRGVSRERGRPRRARDGARRRRPRLADLRRAASTAPAPRSGCARSTTTCRPTTAEAELLDVIDALNARPRRRAGSSCSCRCPPTSTPARVTRAVDPRRTSTGSRRPTPACSCRGATALVPATPLGRDGAAAPTRAPTRRRRGGRGRAQRTSSASRWPRCCSRGTRP